MLEYYQGQFVEVLANGLSGMMAWRPAVIVGKSASPLPSAVGHQFYHVNFTDTFSGSGVYPQSHIKLLLGNS